MPTARDARPPRRSSGGFVAQLFAPVDIASLAVFRILFGAVLFWEVWRFFENDWIRRYYIVRGFHFKYYGFEWVTPAPGDWMYVIFAALGVASLGVMLGFFYRLAATLTFFGYAYVFLLDQTRYLNHVYLVVLLCFLMIFVPAHRAASLDARRRPELRSSTVPAWALWLLRSQVAIVYVYAAIAKMNADWIRGAPIGAWIAARDDTPLIGPLLAHPAAAAVFGFGGLLLDLWIVPLLLWRPTRVPALIAVTLFHVLNKWLFDIGIFPVLAMSATLLLLDPGWPRRLTLFFAPGDAPSSGATGSPPTTWARRLVLFGGGAWLAVQLLVPLRHWLYPGNVHWTEEGHRFSWHMKLRDKDGKQTTFWVTNPRSGKRWAVDLGETLSTKQRARVGTRPDMTLQFAHHLGRKLELQEGGPVEVRVESRVSLNGREPQLLFDPGVDLTQVPRDLRHAEWILPLVEPLPKR